jgi:hypothetical protein
MHRTVPQGSKKYTMEPITVPKREQEHDEGNRRQ